MRHLTERIENLSPAKRALLQQKLRALAQEENRTIERRADHSSAPLTVNQESLWFLEQLNPSTSLYNLSDAMRLSGTLHLDAAQHALDAIVARHEALRTTFVEADGEPQQIIHDTMRVPLAQFEVSAQPDAEAEALRLLSREAETPFDLQRGPLARFTLVRLNAREHILLVLLHHIISDGWSVGVFWQEFAQLYTSFVKGDEAALPALPIQFGDYAAWTRAQKNVGEQLAYWKTQLADAPALLELPTDHPRPAVQSFRGAQLLAYWPEQLRNDLQALSQQAGCTLFMTLLAGFKALLARYSGQEDLVVGTPLAGRTVTETESLIGFFVNLLALRTDLTGDPTFRELLQRVRDTTLGAFSHQDLSFEQLVAELRPERSLSYNPIFQTAFALQNESGAALSLPGLQLSPVKLGSITAKFDLLVSLCEVPAGLRVVVEYNTDLFEAATIERLMQHYQTLLTGVVANPLRRVSQLPLLSAAEEQRILVEWNDTTTAYPRDVCIHQLFEAQAERTPDAIAVVAGDLCLTYRELNQRANQVAHYLRARGVGPDTLVGLFTERSLLMVIGVLGILKAGGAYLPLDADYPKARLQFMLEDAQTPVLLTQQKLRARLPDTAAEIVCLDSEWEKMAGQPEANLVNGTAPEHLAYVIYTSGSTGQPKGVAVPHRAVNRLVFNTNYVQLDSTDCIAQVSNISFDAATFELWGALLHGAQLVLISKDIALSPQAFVTQLREHNVTTLFLTTALFNLLAREVPDAFRTLKTLMFGGEACDPAAVRDVLNNGAPQRLLHVYGPTESTTFASWHLIKAVPEDATTIPIGRPLSNTTLYLLDRHLNPVPVGVPGELYVGGDGLAREYWRRPALTTEKFVGSWWSVVGGRFLVEPFPAHQTPDTRHQTPNTDHRPPTTDHLRLYRTGDIARYLPDGSIEFIGRQDQQIKLRGFRVELGEIEAALLQHEAVQDCVVLVSDHKTSGKRLVAYCVTSMPLPANELRAFLQQRLPDYMVPAVFMHLDELPLNPNGKVDRSKLPPPEIAPSATDITSTPAQDELELRLTWLWEKVLSVSPIGVQDNFFDLGGHSLLAVRLFTEMEKNFGVRLPLATLFQAPTIAQLAELLRQRGWQPTWKSLVALRPNGTRPPFFCVHAVGGNVLEYNDLARYFAADQPFYGLQSLGLDGQSAPLTSIEAMAAHYLVELRQIQPTGPYYLGGRSFGGTVAFEMARQLHTQDEQVALLAMFDSYPLGWLKLCTEAEARQYESTFFQHRIQRHWDNWKALRLTDKVAYVLNKAQYKKRKYKHLLWRLQQHFNNIPAPSLHSTLRHIEELNYRAAKQYVPQVYPGALTFFCAEGEVSVEESITGWQRLAAGGVKVIYVPGDHQTMIQEPHVQQLAAQLTACLRHPEPV
jgi:amino acid adenylation domain-containing protein